MGRHLTTKVVATKQRNAIYGPGIVLTVPLSCSVSLCQQAEYVIQTKVCAYPFLILHFSQNVSGLRPAILRSDL